MDVSLFRDGGALCRHADEPPLVELHLYMVTCHLRGGFVGLCYDDCQLFREEPVHRMSFEFPPFPFDSGGVVDYFLSLFFSLFL